MTINNNLKQSFIYIYIAIAYFLFINDCFKLYTIVNIHEYIINITLQNRLIQ